MFFKIVYFNHLLFYDNFDPDRKYMQRTTLKRPLNDRKTTLKQS